MANPKVNPETLRNAIRAGNDAAWGFVKANPEGPHWFPCGFAWLTYKCRKNAAEASVLIDEGFRWDDYRKTYTLSAGKWHNTQSMDYKVEIIRAFKAAAGEAGVAFGIEDRID